VPQLRLSGGRISVVVSIFRTFAVTAPGDGIVSLDARLASRGHQPSVTASYSSAVALHAISADLVAVEQAVGLWRWRA
jgi:hypothetical protein